MDLIPQYNPISLHSECKNIPNQNGSSSHFFAGANMTT